MYLLVKNVKTLDEYKLLFTFPNGETRLFDMNPYLENFETETPMGKFSLQMMGAVGELECGTIAQNVKMGMMARAREGRWNGGIDLK